MTEYERWLNQPLDDPDLTEELQSIQGQEEEINDRFYMDLEFGTAGLRGVIGAGTNRMNVYTVRKATQGLANYLLKHANGKPQSVAIAHDSRNKGVLFCQQSAAVLAANGIKAYLYPQLMPTPALSFAVRHLQCDAGICVTASHNPAKYNGYKAYGSDGCQITSDMADGITQEIKSLDIFKLVYTPLNGAGKTCVLRILERIGIRDVTVVPEQAEPDGNFPTCPYPNPEFREALQKGLELCEQVQPDLLLATDPDSDRVGIAVKQGGEFKLMTGNEVGILLLDFIARVKQEQGKLPAHPVAVTTIVSTDMVDPIAQHYGVEMRRCLTGFKYIGDIIAELEQKEGNANSYLLGFEESYGYLSGGYVRDKDAVDGSMLICEMASYYKRQGKTLVDVMNELYETYGYYQNATLNFGFEGEDGMKTMQKIMDTLRQEPPTEIAGAKVVGRSDYQLSQSYGDKEGAIDLPKSNVLEYRLENGCKLIVRPSGTEPKIKIYLSGKGATMDESLAEIEKMKAAAPALLGL